jgi:hypothetical protein
MHACQPRTFPLARQWILSVGKRPPKLWDTESWQDVLTLSGPTANSVYSGLAMSGDGNVIGYKSNRGFLQVWQAPTWQEIEAAEKAPIGPDTAQ